jgi:hypothetical protein
MIVARFLVPLALGGSLFACSRDALVGRLIQPSGSGGQPGGHPMDAGQDGPTDAPVSRHDAGSVDAAGSFDGESDGGDGAAVRCAVSVDGGTVPCTTTIAAAGAYDYFCGLKGGAMNGWGSTPIAVLVDQTAPAVAAAPPNLVQLALSNDAPADHTFCGVDESTHGFCWTGSTTRDLGTNLRAAAVSFAGACQLGLDGSAECDLGIYTVPTPPPYVQIVLSDDNLFGLDSAGVPSFRLATFPPGIYTELAANNAYRIGAVRSDGTAVTFWPAGENMLLRSGTYLHLALDDAGRACGIDEAGALSCWLADAASTAVLFTNLPTGSFVQIVGGGASFCALRASGTTVCWGDQEIIVPAGW